MLSNDCWEILIFGDFSLHRFVNPKDASLSYFPYFGQEYSFDWGHLQQFRKAVGLWSDADGFVWSEERGLFVRVS